MFRAPVIGVCALLTLVPSSSRFPLLQEPRNAASLIADLDAGDAAVRARAPRGLRELGDLAAEAIPPLVRMLADGSPVEARVCSRLWWRGGVDDMTTPGEQAAAALAAIGSRAFPPVLAALKHEAWNARRNAAWTLGALDDARAVTALVEAVRDREAPVRAQAAWALGAIDHTDAVPALIAALRDQEGRVRCQAAWALGAIDDRAAVQPLTQVLADADADVRKRPRGPSAPSMTLRRSTR
jgi:HEAT repeat protein